jgi:hypothetical protein
MGKLKRSTNWKNILGLEPNMAHVFIQSTHFNKDAKTTMLP